MANKFDLKIAVVTITTVVQPVGEEVTPADRMVPKGKTRFVCFVKHSVANAAVITLAEGAAVTGQETVKDITDLGVAANLAYPDKIDVENPLFSVAGEKYLTLGGADADGYTTVVYFDE